MTGHRTAATGVSEAAVERWGDAPTRPGSKWWTLVAVCLGIFILLLDITIVTVALPDIQRGLGPTFAGRLWRWMATAGMTGMVPRCGLSRVRTRQSAGSPPSPWTGTGGYGVPGGPALAGRGARAGGG